MSTTTRPAETDTWVDPAKLAERFGTPAYVYNLALVRAAHADLRRALPADAALYYSLKANPHPLVVAQLAALGCRAEVSSTGELDTALAAGVQPAQVLMTGPGKSPDAIGHALDRGVTRFSVDSPTDLARVGSAAAIRAMDARCLLRVNADENAPGMGLAMTGVPSQFGADASWIRRSPDLFRSHGRATVTGLHLYMGTNLSDEDTLLRQFDIAIRLAASLHDVIGPVTEIDLGGGFGAPYARAGTRPRLHNLAARLDDLLDEHLPGWRNGSLEVAFESGRYLVGDCGTLLSRILDVKQSKGRSFVVLDTGVHHLGGMAGLRRVPPMIPTITAASPGPATPDQANIPCTVAGPLCTPLDTFGRDLPLPDPQPGLLATIPNVGAYGLTASLLAFLGHPAPVEVITDGAEIISASRLHIHRRDTDPACHPVNSSIT